MDKGYADTVRLLLTIAPDVFANTIFAMKGGTAINLFLRDMPRLSVDIDVTYTPWHVPRELAFNAIAAELASIAQRVTRLGLTTHTIANSNLGDCKLLIHSPLSQVKVEVNTVFRGTVLPIEHRPLAASTAAMFSVELSLPILAPDELYGGKLVAALDRQHPRDLFDVWQMYEAGGLSDAAIECFVTYLAGHNRPTHEVLFANPKDISLEYRTTFIGMTTKPMSLETLVSTRTRLLDELAKRLTNQQRVFLVGLANAQPDWSLLSCPHASELPALRRKLANLEKFKKSRRTDFEHQAQLLKAKLQ